MGFYHAWRRPQVVYPQNATLWQAFKPYSKNLGQLEKKLPGSNVLAYHTTATVLLKKTGLISWTPEEESFQDESHNNGHHDHGEDVEGHEEDAAPLANLNQM